MGDHTLVIELVDRLAQRSDVFDRRSAAPSDDPDPEFGEVAAQDFGHRLRSEREARLAIHQHRQPGVGHHRDVTIPVPGQVPHMVGHLGGTGRAVQAERSDRIGTQRGDGGSDLRTHEHGSGRLDRDAHHDRYVVMGPSRVLECGEAGVDRTLDLEKILAGLDQEGVNPTIEQAERLFAVGIEHRRPGDLAEREEFRPGSHGSQHEARTIRRGVFIARGTSDLRGLAVQVTGPVDQFLVELGEDVLVGPEGVGLDRIRTRGEESGMNLLDEFRAGANQQVDTVLPTEVVALDFEINRLKRGPHRPIEKKDAAIEFLEECTGHGGTISTSIGSSNPISHSSG